MKTEADKEERLRTLLLPRDEDNYQLIWDIIEQGLEKKKKKTT